MSGCGARTAAGSLEAVELLRKGSQARLRAACDDRGPHARPRRAISANIDCLSSRRGPAAPCRRTSFVSASGQERRRTRAGPRKRRRLERSRLSPRPSPGPSREYHQAARPFVASSHRGDGSIAACDLLIQSMQLTHERGERRAHAGRNRLVALRHDDAMTPISARCLRSALISCVRCATSISRAL